MLTKLLFGLELTAAMERGQVKPVATYNEFSTIKAIVFIDALTAVYKGKLLAKQGRGHTTYLSLYDLYDKLVAHAILEKVDDGNVVQEFFKRLGGESKGRDIFLGLSFEQIALENVSWQVVFSQKQTVTYQII